MRRLLCSPIFLVKAAVATINGRRNEQRLPAAAASPLVAAGARVGKHDVALTELVRERPGLLVAQAAEQIGVHPTALYPIIRRLETRGDLVKLGRELHPTAAAGAEQLWCEAGHFWTRARTRGRKPTRCPQHR